MVLIYTLAILCGGKSRRLGKPKAFLDLNSQQLIKFVIKRVKKYFKNIFLVVKTEEDKIKLKDNLKEIKVLRDKIQNKEGPIFALHTALENIDSEIIFILSCDTPLVNLNIVDMLIKSIGEHNAVVPRWPNGYVEPLYAVYRRKNCLEIINKFIKEGNYTLNKIIKKTPKVLYFSTKIIEKIDPKLDCLLNINTVKDYDVLLKKLTK